MDRDAFLADWTQSLERLQQERAELNTVLPQIVQAAAAILTEYQRELRQRGVEVHVSATLNQLGFMMTFPDGTFHGFSLESDRTTGGYHFQRTYANTEADYRVPPWRAEEFEVFLQSVITEYLSRYLRHGDARGER